MLRTSPHCTGTPDEADHIVDWPTAQLLGWSQADFDDETNGQATCRACHQQKTLAGATAGRAQARANRSRRPQEQHPGLLR